MCTVLARLVAHRPGGLGLQAQCRFDLVFMVRRSLLLSNKVAARRWELGCAQQTEVGDGRPWWGLVDLAYRLVYSQAYETMSGESLFPAMVGGDNSGSRGRRYLVEAAAMVMCSSPLSSLGPRKPHIHALSDRMMAAPCAVPLLWASFLE